MVPTADAADYGLPLVYRSAGWVRLTVLSPDPSRQNVRDRSCCGPSQDRNRDCTRSPSCQ